VESNTIVQTFSSDPSKDTKALPKISGNFISVQGNSVQYKKVTMRDCDVIVLDMDPADPLDFFLDRFSEQLAAGYTKISPNFQLRTYVKDYGKLPSKPSGTPNVKK
jgi:hypothetical protein